jgi:hypothetical protein
MVERWTYTALIGAGALPFALAALAPLAGADPLPLVGPAERLITSYGLGIVSFLTGVHWATQLYAGERAPVNLFVLSNVVFLVVWFAFLADDVRASVVTQSLAFTALLAVDYSLRRRGVIDQHYFRMRTLASAVAIVSLLSFLTP